MNVSKPAWEIAHLAASYLIDGIAESFLDAKSKAAAALGYASANSLPTNILVQKALVDNLRLLEGQEWIDRINAMRVAAVQAMQFLSEFEPHLVGSVLYGTATSNSAICLHVYSDDLESVIWRLNDAGIKHHLSEVTLSVQHNRMISFPCLEVAMSEFDFDVIVCAQSYRFNPPNSPLDGKPYQRADQVRVQELIDDNQTLFGKYLDASSLEFDC